MSTSSVSSSTSSSGLSSLGGNAPLQITGLASGLDTNQIITELMSIQQQPITNLQNQESGLTALNTQLTSVQTSLQTLANDAMALMDPSLFQTSQQVTSSDTTRVSATSSTGAGIGGYQVSVSQMANSAQRTFTWSSPTSNDAITIDGHQETITAGESIQDFVASINSDQNATVYAAATDSGTVVLSDRATGNTGSSYIQVADSGGALTEQTGKARAGQDAVYSVDGVGGTSSSNTVTGAIAGVTLTLNGVTTTSGPVTVNVSPPAPSSSNISAAIQQFVTDYNSTISSIQTQLAQAPSSSDPTQGTLFGDSELSDLLSSMRTAMYTSVSGLSSGMSNMIDLGVSTGATSGSGAPSASSIAGNLTLNATTLTNALAANPTGVQQVLEGWANSFASVVKPASDPAGTIDQRIQGDTSQISLLDQRISDMQSALADKQTQLTNQFAALEAVLSQNQSESSWLTSQIAALPGSSSG
ncbi:MAG TPA: flagellar filament capping protein FliD [Solirubrobacteraceae bacterium]|nr:flagellar filament capping protein FliD [Solirubrobacteraceae bacterium]